MAGVFVLNSLSITQLAVGGPVPSSCVGPVSSGAEMCARKVVPGALVASCLALPHVSATVRLASVVGTRGAYGIRPHGVWSLVAYPEWVAIAT